MSGGSAVAGQQNGRAKLVENQVHNIRVKYALGDITMKELAKMYGVSEAAIRQIIHRKTWTHL